MTDQPHQQGLGGDKDTSERVRAFNRGDLAHEGAGPEHKPTTSDLTMQDYADGWGVSIEEAKRRFTHYRMTNPKTDRYFKSGTHGQGMPRDRSNRDRSGEAEQRRERRRKHGDGRPRTDKTTPFDTMTREELMRYREEEAQSIRDEK